MKTIVSVTPLAVEADSRTYKEAASFARCGYRSIVVEGRQSSLARNRLPFELLSVDGAPADRVEGAFRGSRLPRSAIGRLPPPLRERIRGLYRLGTWLLAYRRKQWRAARVLPPASLYVSHEFELFPAVYAASRRHDVPFIYDAHDLYSTLITERRSGPGDLGMIVRMRNNVERLCVRSAAARITVAPRLARLQEQRFQRPFAVVRNAHDPRLDEDSPTSVREAARAPKDVLLLVLVGNAKPSLAISETLEAIAQLPADVRLACVGRGYDRYLEEVARFDLDSRVSFVGAVLPTQIVSFLRDADVAANVYVPRSVNAYNSLPNGFFQSIAAGLPILYPRLPEIERIAREYELGVPIDPQDPSDIAAALRRLLNDRDALAGFEKNARRAARALTWAHEEDEFMRVVERAMSQSGADRITEGRRPLASTTNQNDVRVR